MRKLREIEKLAYNHTVSHWQGRNLDSGQPASKSLLNSTSMLQLALLIGSSLKSQLFHEAGREDTKCTWLKKVPKPNGSREMIHTTASW